MNYVETMRNLYEMRDSIVERIERVDYALSLMSGAETYDKGVLIGFKGALEVVNTQLVKIIKEVKP